MTQPQKIDLPRKPQYLALATEVDIFRLFRKIEKRFENCFLLESLGEDSHFSRYSLIGFDPEYLFSAQDNQLIQTDSQGQQQVFESENPYYLLRQIIPQDIICRGYAGGLVGFIGYDSVNYFEPSLTLHSSKLFEPFKFGLFTDGIMFDKMTGEVIYFYYKNSRVDLVRQLLKAPDLPDGPLKVESLGDTMTREQHTKAVTRVKQDITDGLIFQCEVGFKSRFRIQGDTLPLYQSLRESNPSPQMYYVKFGEQKILGASPELLFRLRQGEMETYPLAGTAPRGQTPEQDLELARRLLRDPKEIAEHNMLVDLHRNDIGRVAQFGTVKIRHLMDIKRFSHVQHISSEIAGIIADGEDMFSALAGNFPAGTLTGAPKIEAMKIINQLEPDGRGPYGGAVGHFGLNGDCTFAIPIRTIFMRGQDAYVQTCGGIVYDSDPDNEYQEIQNKFASSRRVLEKYIAKSAQGKF